MTFNSISKLSISFVIFIATMVLMIYFISCDQNLQLEELKNNSKIENLTILTINYVISEPCKPLRAGCGSQYFYTDVRNEDSGLIEEYIFVKGWEVNMVGNIDRGVNGKYYVYRGDGEKPTAWLIL